MSKRVTETNYHTRVLEPKSYQRYPGYIDYPGYEACSWWCCHPGVDRIDRGGG